ncbi:MAG: DUF4037 domain-containing protein [Lachnospiraceae bacterium]|nr:DUF4037 domain-containing protein [Lachnospiraceae bacterium]
MSRKFYVNQVAPMIRGKFPEYESRIAVGIAGEGSDCFGYDDFISRDHDFGTGVCLWLTDEDFKEIGYHLSIAYHELFSHQRGTALSERLSDRRGVMKIRDFYSNILLVDCDTDNCTLTEEQWLSLDHSCLATAVNGEVFRDDLGRFTAFRNFLLNYYPDKIWRIRIANELHNFSSALQVNYMRCMLRSDTVAAEMCRAEGLKAAMELFFLLNRSYAPYYKWTYRALTEVDKEGNYSALIKRLAETPLNLECWKYKSYLPGHLNYDDEIVNTAESLAKEIVDRLNFAGLIKGGDAYLERYVDEIIK